MATQYDYTGKTSRPVSSAIHDDVGTSTMTDKTIEYCTWNESDDILHVNFTNALSGADKIELDTIVTNNS